MKGKIVAIKPYGLFITLENDKSAFCHISESSNRFIKNLSDCFKVNDEVECRILDDKEPRCNVSLKLIKEDSSESPELSTKHSKSDFNDLLQSYLKESEQQLKDINMRQKRYNKRK